MGKKCWKSLFLGLTGDEPTFFGTWEADFMSSPLGNTPIGFGA